jgi:hypothetical protein
MRFARPRRALHPIRWPLLTAAGALLMLIVTSAGSSGAVSSVTYHAGWNLVGAPDGTRYAGADGPIYTLQPGDMTYEAFPAGTPAIGGAGYWVYFGGARTLDLPDGQGFVTVQLPPGQWVLIGNPSGLRTAPVTGADAVFTYDPGRGYRAVNSLLPGQGALAYSQDGALITIGVADMNAGEQEPETEDIPVGPVGGLDAGGCRTGDVLTGVWKPSRLQMLEPCRTLTGTVASVRTETDGDYHITVLPDAGYEDFINQRNRSVQHGGVVVEVIPADQSLVTPPRKGEHVRVTGAFVLDRDHGWLELHPAWSIAPVP